MIDKNQNIRRGFSTAAFFLTMAMGVAAALVVNAAEMAREAPAQGPEQNAKELSAASSVELNGDTVEYSLDGEIMTAEGNVKVIHKGMTLTCDKIEVSRKTNIGHATGHVRLVATEGEFSEITGEDLSFNFNTMTGTFDGASFFAYPYFGHSPEVAKFPDHLETKHSYITTCDHDKPHFRMTSTKMEIYPGEQLIARNIRMIVGKVPLFYLPKFTQDLTNKKPKVILTPGYSKEWGAFLLSKWRYRGNDNLKGTIHLDAREKKDIASGFDLNYNTPNTGSGLIKTYYMNERSISSKRFYKERPTPTVERERFKAEWRHKWEVDKKTDAVLQYYKLSDSDFLKDYFEREYDEDSSPETFFLMTRVLPSGALSFRTDGRVNRFDTAVERLPEIRYDLSSKKLFEKVPLYLSNTTTYSNLTQKYPSPTEINENTMRVDANNELSYAMKAGIFEVVPFVGGENTYYTKTKDPEKYDSIRGIFRSGAGVSTRFFRVYDVQVEKFGLQIHRLRHIFSPKVAYEFRNEPTVLKSQLDQYDTIDSLTRAHGMTFSFENKLQTKRDLKTVDLLRAIISSDFNLKEDIDKGGFENVKSDIDFRPTDWLTFYMDSKYDTHEEHLSTLNFDLYINGGEKWEFNIGKRWDRDVDDQLTTGVEYTINPKWAVETYTRFDLNSGTLKEQEYTLRRDLHEWVMDLNFLETRSQGDEIWLIFTLKAFPDMVIDMGTSFNKRKAGSQSSEGE